MLNIHELERQWLRYKIKSYIPLVLSILASVSIIGLFFIYMPLSDTEDKNNVPVQTTEAEPSKEQAETVVQQKPSSEPVKAPIELNIADNTQEQIRPEPQQEKSTLVLKPSLHFMDNIEDGLTAFIEEEMPIQEPVTSTLQGNETVPLMPENETPANATDLAEETNENRLNITSNKSDTDLKDVIRRFKKNKNPALSLFIAKRYYAAGEYQKSYNYALMTNEIDKSIEESWIIFSKSLVKLGQHELAINTLKSYLKTTKSTAADVLLRKIESGTFK